MPSPFPGMDPWLEGTMWPDVHATLLPLIRAAIVAQLPEGYAARIEEYVWLTEDQGSRLTRRGRPDLIVTEIPNAQNRHENLPAVIAVPTARVDLPLPKRVRRKRAVHIIDTDDRSVITVLELLSPSDKLPKVDRSQYLAKREELFAAGANLVEIDLLRKGLRVPTGDLDFPDADYLMLVSRANEFPAADVWSFTVRDPIPVVPVPLKPDHAPITLDLHPCLDSAYDASGYENLVDYDSPPVPPLRKPDAEWAASLLKKPARKRK